MRCHMRNCLLLLSLIAISPVSSVEAQAFRRPFRHCCETCQMSHAECSCGQAAVVVPQPTVQLQSVTQTRPVVKTELRPQQVTTYRDVVETHVRNEQIVENVPTTTYRNVTVDEGGYQMVWVSKPVTKQVAQTVVQQQVKTKQVPYQVTRRIPQTTTQMVPVQTVQHVTETVPVALQTTAAYPVQVPMMASSCNVCDHNTHATHALGLPFLAPQMGYVSTPIQTAPMSAAIPTMPAISVPTPQTALAPTPINTGSAKEEWQTIPQRGATDSRARSYESPSSKEVPIPADEIVPPRRTTSRFVPVPSAATVWNAKQMSMR